MIILHNLEWILFIYSNLSSSGLSFSSLLDANFHRNYTIITPYTCMIILYLSNQMYLYFHYSKIYSFNIREKFESDIPRIFECYISGSIIWKNYEGFLRYTWLSDSHQILMLQHYKCNKLVVYFYTWSLISIFITAILSWKRQTNAIIFS